MPAWVNKLTRRTDQKSHFGGPIYDPRHRHALFRHRHADIADRLPHFCLGYRPGPLPPIDRIGGTATWRCRINDVEAILVRKPPAYSGALGRIVVADGQGAVRFVRPRTFRSVERAMKRKAVIVAASIGLLAPSVTKAQVAGSTVIGV